MLQFLKNFFQKLSKMSKALWFSCLLITCTAFPAQENERSIYVKGNALFLPVLITNVGVEYQLSPKYTLQADGFVSPWKSIDGNHAQVYMAHVEGRYYFKEAFNKWYVGANTGFGIFDFTKWNYFNTNKFQRGFNIMLGATVGYQFHWKENWNIDLFLGGGTVQSQYRGFEYVAPKLIRYDGAKGWNKSGEFLPYRGGIMIAYKIK